MNKPYHSTLFKKKTPKHVFSCEFCAIYKNTRFLEHLWTTASQIGTENSVGILAQGKEFLARCEKLLLKSTHVKSFIYLFFSPRLTELKFPTQAENLHIIRPVDV